METEIDAANTILLIRHGSGVENKDADPSSGKVLEKGQVVASSVERGT